MKKFLKYAGISISVILVVLYMVFLIVPFFLNGVANSYSGTISKLVEDSCGLKLKLENIKILTTPKLTMGAGVGHIEVSLPSGDTFFSADNVQCKLSILPVLIRKIEIDMVGADNINLNLKVKKDGKFLLKDYFLSSENQGNSDAVQEQQTFTLPFGLRFSNHLPNINVNNYNISFIDIPTDKTYSIYGNNVSVSDFILNKKVKLIADGKVMLQDRVQFNYNVKLLNKVMPDIDLNDILSAPQSENIEKNQGQIVNIIDIFKAIHNNNLTADMVADVKSSGTFEDIHLDGTVNVSNLGVAVDGKKLPQSNIDLKFSGSHIDMYSKLYTADKELTEIIGDFKTGKSPNIELNCKSNAKFKSIIDMIDSIAKSFDYYDFDTLTATGGIDADFSVKSNLKKVESSGYLKVPDASIAYKLYNIVINKINVDIDLSNNIVDIKNAGLSVLNHPLTIKGTIDQNASADLTINANKLQLKSLLLTAGQMSLLKENNVNDGTITANVILKGRLDKIMPKINVSVDNVDVKNLPSNTTIKAPKSVINIETDGKKALGGIDISNVKVLNPMLNISAPSAKIKLGEKDINIESAYILLNNSRIDIDGQVNNYMSKNLNINLSAKGNLLASDLLSMLPDDFRKDVGAKGALPLSVSVTGDDKKQSIAFSLASTPSAYLSVLNVDELNGKNTIIKGNVFIDNDKLSFSDAGIYANNTGILYLSGNINDLYKTQKLNLNLNTPNKISFVIPGFKNSKLTAAGDINITGTALLPYLKGSVSVPSVKIPDMLLTMDNMDINLNGTILKGSGNLKKFVSGGIVAENLVSDFNLTNNVFYLKNLKGDAFNGTINGNISYNIVKGNIGVSLKGSGMDAQKAIAGSAGLKNALSGTLNFNADIKTHGANDIEMMKYLKGNASFDINGGSLGNIGRFENMLLAQNLQSNSIIKAAVSSVSSLPAIKSTAEFKTIKGNLLFNNGWATLNPVTTTGSSMAYYITGTYNLLNATANLTILGRISAEVVSLLGPLGDLSVSKLTSYIPKFGTMTGNLINALTSDPKKEKISSIPALSSGNTNYKDFKVIFNGGVESKSSVKSFKWLSNCDTSAIEKTSVKEQVQETKQAVKDAVQQKVDEYNAKKQVQKEQAQEAQQQMKDAVEGLKNLKNLFK